MLETHLKVLPAYTGAMSLEQALADPRGQRLLWLEILVNDRLDLSRWCQHAAVQEAYQKACRWFTAYRSVITEFVPRQPLPADMGPIDYREYRTVMEALHFVGAHH